MRLYAKLGLFIAAFAAASSTCGRQWAAEAAFEARVAYVMAFGGTADYEALLGDTQRALAEQGGRIDVHQAGVRYRALLAQGLEEAARHHHTMTEEEFCRLQTACARDAFGPLADAETHPVP
jgi:hypothetical protein